MPRKFMNSGFSNWKANRLPDLTGKLYVITGGNSGIGYEAAKHLARAGGDIVLACRSVSKAETAATKLKNETGATVDTVQLDLASLSSVRKAAENIRAKYKKIDGLINNAGVMQTPKLKTEDGFEMQVGTNHLGHFLWAGLLLDLVEAAEGRIVVVSSIVHLMGRLNMNDFMSERRYDPTTAYIQSKAANLVFAVELDRRLKAAGSKATCIACHPGYSNTKLQSTGPTGLFNLMYKVSNPLVAQPAEKGALPTVLAAAGKEAKPGGYYGPQWMNGMRGPVGDARVARYALNKDTAKELWEVSENMVDFTWKI